MRLCSWSARYLSLLPQREVHTAASALQDPHCRLHSQVGVAESALKAHIAEHSLQTATSTPMLHKV